MNYQNNNAPQQQYAQNNNMYNNGYGFNPAYPFNNGGMVQNPNLAQQPRMGNWLSKDKLALLRKGIEKFTLSVSDEDIARSQCNHYNENGQSMLVPDPDGSGRYTCQICGSSVNMAEHTPQEVEAATQNILDILNQAKMMYLSIDPSAACEYFQIMAFIEKIPKLYDVATKDFRKYENVDSFVPSQGQNPFNLFGMLTNPGMGMYQQPYGVYQPQMQMPYGNPAYTNMGAVQNAGYAVPNPTYNPMYGGQPMAPQQPYGQQPMNNGYQPQTTGFNMAPQGAAQPQAQAPQQNTQPQQPVNTPGAQYVQQTPPAPQAGKGTPGDVKVDTAFKG